MGKASLEQMKTLLWAGRATVSDLWKWGETNIDWSERDEVVTLYSTSWLLTHYLANSCVAAPPALCYNHRHVIPAE